MVVREENRGLSLACHLEFAQMDPLRARTSRNRCSGHHRRYHSGWSQKQEQGQVLGTRAAGIEL
jgi:hypothetical protein